MEPRVMENEEHFVNISSLDMVATVLRGALWRQTEREACTWFLLLYRSEFQTLDPGLC